MTINTAYYWVYILNCENGTYYTGYTDDLDRRFREHVSGTSKCKYTRSFKPINIAQFWQIAGTKSQAMKVESFIKKMTKQQKTQLILCPIQLKEIFDGVIDIKGS